MSMQTMHPAVLLGSCGWEQSRMPPDEFELRMKQAHALMDAQGWRAIFVYGDAVAHNALGFLTNFIPRLRWAIAMLPREGVPRILLSVTARDIPAMSLMTWIEDVHTGWTWNDSFDPWFAEFCGREDGTPKVGLLGKDLMRVEILGSLEASVTGRIELDRADEIFAPLLSKRRPREVALIGDAWRIVAAAADTMAASWQGGADGMHAAIEAERRARRMAAHDVRVLFSVDGGRTLLPFYGITEGSGDPMVAYIAVKYLGYWAESFVTIGAGAPAAKARAAAALDAMIDAAKPGATAAEIAKIAATHLDGAPAHPVIGNSFGHAIGLSISEPPEFTADNSAPLQVGNCYSLRFGLAGEKDGAALVSAMVKISEDGNVLIGRHQA
jgi:Xaa-Pro aminopeptidase